MLLELRYFQQPHNYFNNVPCTRPYMCFHDKYNNSQRVKPRVVPYVEPGSKVAQGDYAFYKCAFLRALFRSHLLILLSLWLFVLGIRPVTESTSAQGLRWMLRPYDADYSHSPPREGKGSYVLKDVGNQVRVFLSLIDECYKADGDNWRSGEPVVVFFFPRRASLASLPAQ